MRASVSTISRMRARNQGSKAVIAWMSSFVKPSRMAWAMTRRRSGVTSDSFFDTAARSGAPGMAISSKPVRPGAMPDCKLQKSCKVNSRRF